MRTKYALTVLMAVGILLALIWLLRPKQAREGSSALVVIKQEASQENPPAAGKENGERSIGAVDASSGPQHQLGNVPSASFDSPVTTQQTLLEFSNILQRGVDQFNEDYKWPIEFYGKVLDENMNPVPDANAHCSWSVPYPNEPPERDVKSDAGGLFALTGEIGHKLVVNVNKAGYYTTKSNQTDFEYSRRNNAVPPHAHPDNPAIFRLRKRGPGADLITSKYGIKEEFGFGTPLDGTPIVVDLLARKVGQGGQLQVSQITPENSPQKNEWSVWVTIPDGGLVEQTDEFPYEAPESGYQSVMQFQFQQGRANWTTSVRKDFYIKFGNPPRYGRLHLDTSIVMAGVRLTYVINPDGSRYLEPKRD
jgi:hypothetical protein